MSRNNNAIILFGLFGCVSFAGGCSLLSPRDDALASYEATRRELANDRAGVSPVSYEEQEPEDGISLTDFAPDNIGGTVRELTGNGPDRELARTTFEQAKAIYNEATQLRAQGQVDASNDKFIEAGRIYARAAKNWPSSSLQQDAIFMQGECYFFADNYPKAEEAYERLLKEYPHSRHLDRVQPRRFAIADYWVKLDESDPQALYEYNVANRSRPGRDTRGHALRVFDRIRLDDPTGKLADDATLALGNAHFARGDVIRADEYFTDLRRTFPSSEHQFHAHFLGLKAKLMSYQGADYSGTSLEEAEKLLKQIRRQFPLESQQEAEYLARANAEVRFKQAERLWLQAKRYDRRTEYGAARFHYDLILRDYDDTPFAQRAEARMNQIGGLPAIPPQRMGWLVKLFPVDESAPAPLATSGTLRR